jgi:hypothetical protein
MDDTTVDNAATDMDDDPLDEVNDGYNRTVGGESNHSLPDEEATTITPEEEPSTNSGETIESLLSKKAAESPKAINPGMPKLEKPHSALHHQMITGCRSGDDRTDLATIRDEIIELRAKMMMLETNQSTLLTRLTELDAKPLSVGTAEPSEPAAADDGALPDKTTHEPGSIEPCANAAIADMTNYETSKVARTGTDQPILSLPQKRKTLR